MDSQNAEETKSIPELQHPSPDGQFTRPDQANVMTEIAFKDSDELLRTTSADYMEFTGTPTINKKPLKKKNSGLDNAFMLSNYSQGDHSQEIKKIEESFGGTQHLFKKLTVIDYDLIPYDGEANSGFAQMKGPYKSLRSNSFKPNAALTAKRSSSGDSKDSSSNSECEVVPYECDDKEILLLAVDGPGLDQEIARQPSTTNVTTTLF